jgi:hypothetical protein
MHPTSRPTSPAGLIEARRRTLANALGRTLRTPEADASPLPEDRRAYLLEEVQELYWNDLEWENVTGEEELEGGPLTQLTFPGVLAFVRGLLLTEVPADSPVGPSPRPQVVEDLLDFLAERVLELTELTQSGDVDEPTRIEHELRLTSELVNQVLLVYHGVSPEEVGPDGPEGNQTPH